MQFCKLYLTSLHIIGTFTSARACVSQMSALKPIGKPGQEEEGAQVHRIRITLTSRNVKNLEKGRQRARGGLSKINGCFAIAISSVEELLSLLVHIPLYVKILWHSLHRPDPRCQGQAAEGEGPCADAHQGAAHHHQEVTLWRGYQHLGSL